jgi:hypothetical protein
MASRYTVPASVPQQVAQTSGIKRERSPQPTISQAVKKQKVGSQDESQEESWEEEQYESWDEDQLDQFDSDGAEGYESWEEEQYEREEEEQDEVGVLYSIF